MLLALISGAALVVTLGGAVAVHRFLPHHSRKSYDEVNGVFFATIGVLYTVLLAFVVVAVWEDYDTAKTNTYTEANAIPGLYYSATLFPTANQVAIQNATVAYARDVVDDEWSLLATGGESPKVDADASAMRKALLQLPVQTLQQQAIYSSMIDRVNTINSSRRQRISDTDPSIPGFFWVGLLTGAALLVLLGLFFGVPRLVPHLLMLVVLVVIVSGSLFLAYLMEQPFRGPMGLEPAAFEISLVQMGQPTGK
ncbi:MAG TPA: hypothetical protein VHW44_11185 [Pseudonocardiaceae bacterium]|jgi:hypothetical protein|nr:hypothetical protein [Pseudonocardiaceae bacterium]